MAEAVLTLFPEGKLGIGPVIQDGFYYDFDLPRALTSEDLPRIEEMMQRIVSEDHPFQHEEWEKGPAREFFGAQPFKLELIEGIEDPTVSIYSQRGFTDLCRGPHVASTGQVKVFKLLHVAGAYWRGDEKRPMLQRIYGTAWESQEELDGYLKRLEEAGLRDHRRLGRELGLYSIEDEVGAGLVLWHPKGGRLRTIIEDHWRREHLRGGYEIVYTPHIGRAQLWETSGHLDFYRDSMYAPMEIDKLAYYAKPMNCPFHILIFGSSVRSYRNLPLRLAELGTVYRYERPGVLHGLMRVRGFTQDDAHIFCRPDQVEGEIEAVLRFTFAMLRTFGFQEFELYLATRPEKFVGEPAHWEQATESLRRAADACGTPYHLDEGGGAFYGPKLDVKIKDALGREWQCATVQFDFNEPERFDLSFVGADGKEHRPFMVHRALLGSLERFLGVLIEHYGGAFPAWLAPVQAVVIPIADRHAPYARQVCERLRAADCRAELDDRSERMNARIRDAQLQKVPYMLVVGDREEAAGRVAVRSREEGDLGSWEVERFLETLQQRVGERT